jgi:hypothetical protein
MIFFRHLYDCFNDIWEAATAATAFFHGVVNFGRHDKLPAISIEKLNDSILDLFLSNDIAMANKHYESTPYCEAEYDIAIADVSESNLPYETGEVPLPGFSSRNTARQPGFTFEPDNGSSNRKGSRPKH